MNIGFISLGCSKNRVDTEIMMAALKGAGHKIVEAIDRADAVIINTCGFITEAKEEAIDTIIEVGELKEKGLIDYIIATGCLAQRYGQDLINEMPELNAVVGIADFLNINAVIQKVADGEQVVLTNKPPLTFIEKGPRVLTTPKGSAYLKITEGCNNKCTYCSIPSIRGGLRSRPLEELYAEAVNLTSQGVKELVIIGQDTASYGQDAFFSYDLPSLLLRLNEIEDLEWIRLMYLHPNHINNAIIEVLANNNKIIPYLDIPIQHFSSNILKKMNRHHDDNHLLSTIDNLRSNIKDLVLRTTAMVGFPGETEDDFNQLYNFLENTKFDWLGAFKYSPEEGTPAYLMADKIEATIKEERLDQILTLQNKITREINIERIGTKQKILISSLISKNLYIGRGYFQAPEVDGITVVKSSNTLVNGQFVEVELKAVRDYDMIGELDNEHS